MFSYQKRIKDVNLVIQYTVVTLLSFVNWLSFQRISLDWVQWVFTEWRSLPEFYQAVEAYRSRDRKSPGYNIEHGKCYCGQ